MLAKYHVDGDRTSKLVQFEMAEITATLEAEKLQKTSRWGEWFTTRGRKQRFFICCFVPAMLQLSGNALTSYYLTILLNNLGITNSNTQLLLNMGLTLWGLVTAVFFASLVDRFGRRGSFLFGTFTMMVSYII